MIYMVNVKTKEHRRLSDDLVSHPDWVACKADPDGWIPHDGGECPLPGHVKCKVREDDWYSVSEISAEGWYWEPVTHYCPILDDKEEDMSWNGEGLPPVGVECEKLDMCGGRKKVVIVGHDVALGRAIYRDMDYSDLEYDSGLSKSFRPIRSAEDKAVAAMRDTSKLMRTQAARVYRDIRDGKIPGIRLDAE